MAEYKKSDVEAIKGADEVYNAWVENARTRLFFAKVSATLCYVGAFASVCYSIFSQKADSDTAAIIGGLLTFGAAANGVSAERLEDNLKTAKSNSLEAKV